MNTNPQLENGRVGHIFTYFIDAALPDTPVCGAGRITLGLSITS